MRETGKKRLGRYELGRVLGQGGSGRVYEAVLCGPAGFRKPCAVKVLQDGGDGLAREARLAGLLRHPNLVEVYELGFAEWDAPTGFEDNGAWFCSMELVKGGSLDKRLPLPPAAALDVVRQVARGLIHAHEEVGMVHLDLKPANILMDHGVAKVADLGIAQAQGFHTLVGIRGTPGYVAPEVLAGVGRPDARADVFGLGVVLCELVTGVRRPDDRAPRWLREVLRDALRSDPDQRFPTMVEFAECLAGVTVSGPGIPHVFAAESSPGPSGAMDNRTPDTFESPEAAIPAYMTPLVGRQALLEQVQVALDGHRLVTLKGMGGIGKTRCAAEIAETWGGQGQNRAVVWCGMDSVSDAEGIPRRLADALYIPLEQASVEHAHRQVGHVLQARGEVLLVLDTVGHLVEHLHGVLDWLEQAPGLRVLTTTRTLLRLEGEHAIEVAPLTDSEGIELVLQRVRASGGSLSNVVHLKQLVQRLDGLPLALELTAARLSVMSPEQVLERLKDRFRLLGANRSKVDRHRSLAEALAFSWEGLGPVQQEALGQLALFGGSFTLTDAEDVLTFSAPDAPWALDLVSDLVDRSWLHVDQEGATPRFSMFESVSAFATERAPPSDAAVEAWLAWCAAHGSPERMRALRSRHGFASWETLQQSGSSMRRGFELAIERRRWSLAANIATALVQIRWRTGTTEDAIGAYQTVLKELDSGAQRDRLVVAMAQSLVGLRRPSDVEALVSEVSASSEQYPWGRRWLAEARLQVGDFDGAAMACRKGLNFRPLDSDVRAQLLQQAGNAALRLHRRTEAQQRYTEALSQYRQQGDALGVGQVTANLGALARQSGDAQGAYRHYVESGRTLRAAGDQRSELLVSYNLGLLARSQGRARVAVTAFERASLVASRLGNSTAELRALVGAAVTHVEHGMPVELAHLLDLEHRARALENIPLLGMVLQCQRDAHLVRRDVEAADGVAHRAIEVLVEHGHHLDAQNSAADRSRLWLVGGDHARALRCYDGVGASVLTLSPPSDCQVLGVLAELAQLRGDDEACRDLLERAKEKALVTGMPLVQAAVQLSTCRVLRQSGQDTVAALAEARRLLEASGVGQDAPLFLEWRALNPG